MFEGLKVERIENGFLVTYESGLGDVEQRVYALTWAEVMLIVQDFAEQMIKQP